MFGEDSKKLTPRAVLEYPLGHPPERMTLDAVRAPDPRVIIFDRVGVGGAKTARIRVADHPGEPVAKLRTLEQTYRLHSDGMEFGYGGSGPADCALNILSLVVSPREAWRLHQDFKPNIARIPQDTGGELTLTEVRAWIAARYVAEMADLDRMAEEKEMRELIADIEKEEREAAAADE